MLFQSYKPIIVIGKQSLWYYQAKRGKSQSITLISEYQWTEENLGSFFATNKKLISSPIILIADELCGQAIVAATDDLSRSSVRKSAQSAITENLAAVAWDYEIISSIKGDLPKAELRLTYLHEAFSGTLRNALASTGVKPILIIPLTAAIACDSRSNPTSVLLKSTTDQTYLVVAFSQTVLSSVAVDKPQDLPRRKAELETLYRSKFDLSLPDLLDQESDPKINVISLPKNAEVLNLVWGRNELTKPTMPENITVASSLPSKIHTTKRVIIPLLVISLLLISTMIFSFVIKSPAPSPISSPLPISPTVILEPTSIPTYHLQVLNGSTSQGEAKKLADTLKSKNYIVDSFGNADKNTYPDTLLKIKPSVSLDFANTLKKELSVLYGNVQDVETDASLSADLVVIIGNN